MTPVYKKVNFNRDFMQHFFTAVLFMLKGIVHYFTMYILKIDRVGPVDNRPSTNKLHHFVKKNI